VATLEDESTESLKADNRRFALQESTIRADEGQDGPYDVFILDSGSASGPEQVLAIRRARRSP
jgi:hypothetical protein